ncbi:TPA: hypothetical protein PC505_003923 [Morganella morganii]|nr:hypothetical protein [Morganella morganii]HDF2424468.1 hypothetical protein [Morganella morganii]
MIYNVAKNKKIFSEISKINFGEFSFFFRVLQRLFLLASWSVFISILYIIMFKINIPGLEAEQDFSIRLFASGIFFILIPFVIGMLEHEILDGFYEKHKYKIIDKLLSQYKPLDVNAFINLKEKTNNNVVDFPDYLMDFVRAEDKAYRESIVFDFTQK